MVINTSDHYAIITETLDFLLFGVYSHHIKEILYVNTNSKEDHEIKAKRNTFSLEIEVKKCCCFMWS